MKEQDSSSQTESSATLRSFAPQGAPDRIEQDALPRGSALLLETILMLAKQIQRSSELEGIHGNAASIVDMAGELIAKYNRQMGMAA